MVTNSYILRFLGLFVILLASVGMFGFTQADLDSANNLGKDSRFVLSQVIDCSNNPCNEDGYVTQVVIDEGEDPVSVSYEFTGEGDDREISVINLEGNSNFFSQLSIMLDENLNIDSFTRTFLGFIPGGEVRSFSYEFHPNGAIRSSSIDFGSGLEETAYDINGVISGERFEDQETGLVEVSSYEGGNLINETATIPLEQGGNLIRTSFYDNGVVVSVVVETEEGSQTTEFDLQGRPVTEIFVASDGGSSFEVSFSDGVPVSAVSEGDDGSFYTFILDSEGNRVSGSFTDSEGNVNTLDDEYVEQENNLQGPISIPKNPNDE